jgi:ubiquinone/menaquinone biosynthesis C-methylase UbiE
VAVDLSWAMLKRARRKSGAEFGRRIVLAQADARALPFRSRAFAGVLNCYMVDLLPESDIPIALNECGRVLVPGGLLVLIVMSQQTPFLQAAWMTLYRCSPFLVGGCRPVNTGRWLKEPDWRIERAQRLSQAGFRSEILVARRN